MIEQDGGTVTKDLRQFGGFKRGKRAMVVWLASLGVQLVVMESSGIELDRLEHFFPAIAQLAEEFSAFLKIRAASASGLILDLLHPSRPATRIELRFRSSNRDADHSCRSSYRFCWRIRPATFPLANTHRPMLVPG